MELIRPKKKLSVFRVTGLKILSWVSTLLFLFFFLEKNYNFMHFERHFSPLKMHKIIHFSRKLEKSLGFTS